MDGNGDGASKTTLLVGRRAELGELRAALDRAVGGSGALLLLHGEPGIGKTRLADELAGEARDRALTVLWGRCWEAGGAPPYWPWLQALRGFVLQTDPVRLRELLGPGAGDVAQIVPDLHEVLPDLPPVEGFEASNSEGARFRLFDAASTFLKRAASAAPILLLLDDLQAADRPSLLLLQFLARDVRDARILVCGIHRDPDPAQDPVVVQALAELSRDARTVALRGLGAEDVARYIEMTAGHAIAAPVVETVTDLTEGNPLFVVEVVRLLAAEGTLDSPHRFALPAIPQGVREVLGRRIDHLSEDCRAVLVVAAALGRDFELSVLERVSALTAEQLLNVLQEALDAQVVSEVPGPVWRFRFSHALTRETLYEELRGTRRVRLHRQIGEALEELYAADPEPHVAELAHHFLLAAPLAGAEKAVVYTRRAGDHALAQLAYEEAIRLYAAALEALEASGERDEPLRAELLLALAEAAMKGSETARAKETFLAAAGVARGLSDPELLARAALGYGSDTEGIGWLNVDDPLVRLLRESLSSLPDGDHPLRARALGRLALATYWTAPRDERDRLAAQAVEMAERLGDPAALAAALTSFVHALWGTEDADRRLPIADRIVALARSIGDRDLQMRGHRLKLAAAMELGDMGVVAQEIEAHAQLANEARHPLTLGYTAQFRSIQAFIEGRFSDARALTDEAQVFYERARYPYAPALRLAAELGIAWMQGDVPRLEPAHRSFAVFADRIPAVKTFLALLDLLGGNEEAARSAFEQLAENDFGDDPHDSTWISNIRPLATLCVRLGDARRARILHKIYLPYAQRVIIVGPPPVGCFGPVAHFLGLLAVAMGEHESAAEHFEQALRMAASMRSPPFLAETQAAYAHLLMSTGDEAKAHELARSALATAEELEMAEVAAEARAVLGAEELSPDAAAESAAAAFRREGEYWTIAFEGDVFRLKDTKGVRYIAALLARPGREIHVSDLVSSVEGHVRGSAAHPPDELGQAGGDAGALLDTEAKTAYRERITDLETELEEAREWGDDERVAQAAKEIDALTRELASGVGLGGRDRRAASAAERARQSVTRAVRSTIERIGRANPALGSHLAATIKTGAFCTYSPDPRAVVAWRL